MFNKRIETFLQSLKNDDFRLVTDKSSEYYIHDNQISVVREIILNWTTSENNVDIKDRHSILLAKMQSGKTGVFMGLIYVIEKYDELKNYFNIRNFSILTGMNDTGLEDQLKDRLENQCGFSKEKSDRIVLKNVEMRNIIKSQELIDIKNRLIIVDESHFGNNDGDNTLPKFLEMHDINQKNTSNLVDKNVYFLSVSATPFLEISSDILATKTLIELKQSEGYFGISEFFDCGLIKQSQKSVDWYEEELNKQIKRMGDFGRIGAIIIRSNNKTLRKFLLSLNDWEVIDFTGKDINYEQFNKQHLGAFEYNTNHKFYPKKPRIFLIKGTFRAGVSIESFLKKHIFAVFDSVNSKTHSTAQGLIGRLCGYYKEEPITEFYVNEQSANEYSEWEKNEFSRDYLPNNNKKKIVYDLKNESNIISGKHYGTEMIVLDDIYDEYVPSKLNDNDLLSFIKKYCINYVNEIKTIKTDFIYDAYVYRTNKKYDVSIVEKYFNRIKRSLIEENVNLPPKITINSRNPLEKKDVGNYYLYIFEDSNNQIPLISNKKLYIYIGQICFKHFKKGDLMVAEHLNTSGI